MHNGGMVKNVWDIKYLLFLCGLKMCFTIQLNLPSPFPLHSLLGLTDIVALVPGPCKKCKLLFYRHVTSNSEAACAGRTELPVEQDQGSFSVCV